MNYVISIYQQYQCSQNVYFIEKFFFIKSSKYLFNSIRNLHIAVRQWLLLTVTIGFGTISDCLRPNYAALVFCCTQTITSITTVYCHAIGCTKIELYISMHWLITYFIQSNAFDIFILYWTCNRKLDMQFCSNSNLHAWELCHLNVWSSTFESLCPIGIYFGIF